MTVRTAVGRKCRAAAACLLAVMIAGMLTGCDHLEDGDDALVQTIVGDWQFSYQLPEDSELGIGFLYDEMQFRSDGTCAILYPGGSISGTYRASSDVVSISGSDDTGQQYTMLWTVQSFAPRKIVATYLLEYRGDIYPIAVTLERIE